MMQKTLAIILTITLLGLGLGACNGGQIPAESEAAASVAKTPLVVFAAGSLIIPFADLEQAFEAKYPDIDVLAEYHGSIQVMRHVTEIHEEIDVVATADAALIPMLMYASTVPETGEPYADWYIKFAGNHLALAYTPGSKYASEINADNWPEILARPGVKLGLSDPRFDASGYRTLMAFSLMENKLGRYDLFGPVFDGQFTFPVTIFRDDDLTTITVPEILETKSNSHIVLRGGSIMLIALLESGDIDYAFEYESVIRQHGLEMLSLPETVNMGDEAFESAYQAVQVDLDFQRFATVKPQFRGERISYGISIPANAPHPDEAALFIAFLLSPEGHAIMEADHHPLFDPFSADGFANMPESLQALCVPAEP
jgi:molybdate/tungstate transport system substrate-binding protein